MVRTVQHRTYTVRKGLLDEWVKRWRTSIVPLRLEFGFTIHGAWVDQERSQFVWVLSYGGPESFAQRNQEYWASPERLAMDLNPADFLTARDVREVEEVFTPSAT
jgi:hypothetical protein